MRTSHPTKLKRGFVSYLLVLSTGVILTFLMLFAYRRAMSAHDVQSDVQMRLDYAEKEDAILRSIVAITPNRAIRAMQHNSASSSTISNPLRWRNIFNEAVNNANARTSVSNQVLTGLNLTTTRRANIGDSTLSSTDRIFHQIGGVNDNLDTSYASAGINRSLGTGFPVPLTTTNSTTISRDPVYPIISRDKLYGSLAQNGVLLPVASYPDFNILKYPDINFGYALPRDATDPADWKRKFVAKRNWWAFSMDLSDHDTATTRLAREERDFVLSIYEIPSQLAISAASFMSFGQFASGQAWGNVSIEGGVFAGRATVEGSTSLPELSSRRGVSLSGTSTVGGESFAGNPFAPGLRETYQLTKGEFYPVSLASESGRVAFVPINRGADFFDRFSHAAESNTLSPTTWNNYSVGALQCAMRLDVTAVTSATNRTPSALRFSYLRGGVRQDLAIPLSTGVATGLPPGYIFACNENQSYNFGTSVVDVAYGRNGTYAYQTGVTGNITFNNARFGDPLVGVLKAGYYRPSYPFEVKTLPSGKICIAIYPQRFRNFLTALNADGPAINHSLVVNVDYTSTGINNSTHKPMIPCTDLDYGLILQECSDLTSFTRGFSLVTNLRTFIGDDFNVVPATPPTGYTPSGVYYPPVSLFAPERRYGVDVDPFSIRFAGQVGSLASDTAANPVRPLDSKTVSGADLAANRITVNLRPIRHPAELPPVTMMNWLVVLEERRKEFIAN